MCGVIESLMVVMKDGFGGEVRSKGYRDCK